MVTAIMAQSPPPADWYFVLDTSGEMLAVAQAARADLARLIEVIPEGDRVAVMAMHTRPSEALPLSAIDHFNRQTLMDKVATLDLTSAKDADLGIASISIDGATALATKPDLYAAAPAVNVLAAITGIQVLTSGRHTIKFTGATKNGSASAYGLKIHGFSLLRTGALS